MTGRPGQRLRQFVRNRASGLCEYCHAPDWVCLSTFEVEHCVPRSAGGSDDVENLAYACPPCNRFKSDRVDVPSPDRDGRVPLFNPRLERWDDHFRWLGHTLEGLTDVGRATVVALRLNRAKLLRLRPVWQEIPPQPLDDPPTQ